MQPRALAFLLSILLLFAAGAARADEIPAAVQAAVDAPDRTADDRALDAGRKPAELLAFLGIRPGLRVAELGAGGGYTAELLARVVGPNGRVYGQNSTFLLERFAEKPWSRAAREARDEERRASRPALRRSLPAGRARPRRGADGPLLPRYGVDEGRPREDEPAIFAALAAGRRLRRRRPQREGGHRRRRRRDAAPHRGVGGEAARCWPRASSSPARRDFLRSPDDARDWSASPRTAGERRGHSDRFVLRFVKPKP